MALRRMTHREAVELSLRFCDKTNELAPSFDAALVKREPSLLLVSVFMDLFMMENGRIVEKES